MGDELCSRADVARLLGRVAFGATAGDLDRWEGAPYVDLVDHLLSVPLGGSNDQELLLAGLTTSPAEGQLLWLNRMLTTGHPLEERMTLFWHDHFATAVPKARGDELVVQNSTIRRHALGNFRELVYDLTIDPAMLRWLDGRVNVSGSPNENYAREFFELFTLGAAPKTFGETDIREAARAFTGWTTNDLIGELQKPTFQAANHDPGTKTILGRAIDDHGRDEYRTVVDIALDQPIASRFIASKLVSAFAYRPTTADLLADPDPLVDEVAGALAASGWEIRTALRTMFLSDRFRSTDPTAGRQVVRQPIEMAIHAAKALQLTAIVNPTVLADLRHAGHVPFEPPHVGGWPMGAAWLNPAAYLGSWAAATRLMRMRDLADPLWLSHAPPPSSDIAEGGHRWAAAMGLAELSPTTLATVRDYVDTGDGGRERQLQDGIFLLIANSPDWQVM